MKITNSDNNNNKNINNNKITIIMPRRTGKDLWSVNTNIIERIPTESYLHSNMTSINERTVKHWWTWHQRGKLEIGGTARVEKALWKVWKMMEWWMFDIFLLMLFQIDYRHLHLQYRLGEGPKTSSPIIHTISSIISTIKKIISMITIIITMRATTTTTMSTTSSATITTRPTIIKTTIQQ